MRFFFGYGGSFKGLLDWLKDRQDKTACLVSYITRDVEKVKQVLPDIPLMLDSGAYSWYTKNVKNLTSIFVMDWSWVDGKEFRKYLDEYVQWLLRNKDMVDIYVTLDVIGNAEKSWEITEYITSFGLKPMAVFHRGEDLKWLKKYVDAGYDYIGISGPKGANETSLKWYDEVFLFLGKDLIKQGLKIHLFGRFDTKTVKRYPAYSCDAISWVFNTANCNIRFPKVGVDGSFDFLTSPVVVEVPIKGKNSKVNFTFYEYVMMIGWDRVKMWLDSVGIKDVSWNDVDTALELFKNRDIRAILNWYYDMNVESSLNEYMKDKEHDVWKQSHVKSLFGEDFYVEGSGN